jgi:DNA-directed RNA polymerase subunit beta'
MALEARQVETLTPIRLRYTGKVLDMTTAYDDQDLTHTEPVDFNNEYINTTVGRVILNDALPSGMPYINGLLKKKGIGQLVNYCYLNLGLEVTVKMLDRIKELGFQYATRSGLSVGLDDMVIPDSKAPVVREAEKQAVGIQRQYLDGAITNGERYNKVISIWSSVTEKVADAMFEEMKAQDRKGEEFNPIYIMADSGARGSKQQIRQLAGMRGLMARPSGEIIENPITSV